VERLTPTLLAAGLALSLALITIAAVISVRNLAAGYRDTVLESASTALSDLFIFLDRARLMKLSGVATALLLFVAYALTRSVVIALCVAVACLFGPTWMHRHLRVRRKNRLVLQLPDCLDALVGALRSGLSLPQALSLLAEQLPAPSNQEFGLVVRKLRLGMAIDEVLLEFEQRIATQEHTMFTTCMRISREIGGNLTEALERLADTIRKKITMEGKVAALTSQGKLQGIVVGCLPLFVMWALSSIEPEAMQPLFHSWLGYGVLSVIVMLEGLGFVLIRKIVRIDV
jgi:tight adherence protein B